MPLQKKLSLIGSIILCSIFATWVLADLKIIKIELPFGSLTGLLSALGSLIALILFSRQKKSPEQTEIKVYDLERLRNNVQHSIDARLKSNLYPHTLSLKMREASIFSLADKDVNCTISSDQILETFDRCNGTLLILGAPGAGKTTILYFLAQHLLDRFDPHQDTYPVPILFNLASWAKEKKPLHSWLEDEVAKKVGSRSIGHALIAERRIVPLLDGLDEVAQSSRDACIQAINQYSEVYGTTAIGCRLEQYQLTNVKLAPITPITVCDLEPTQIADYLSRTKHPTSTLADIIRSDQTLLELAQKPLMLVIMGKAYANLNREQIGQLTSEDARLKHIYRHYVERMLKQESGSNTPSAKTCHYLAWLASKLKQRDQTEFLIEYMHPDLLPKYDRYRYQNWIGLALGSVHGLVGGLVLGLLGGLKVGLIGGLAIGLVAWLSNMFTPVETEALTLSEFKQNFGSKKVQRALRKLASSLLGGLAGGLVFDLVVEFPTGLVVGIIFGMLVGLSRAFIPVETQSLTRTEEYRKDLASTQVRQTLSKLIFGLAFIVTGSLMEGVVGGLEGGLAGGLVVGMAGGLVSIIPLVETQSLNLSQLKLGYTSEQSKQAFRKVIGAATLGIIGGLVLELVGKMQGGLALGLAGGMTFGMAWGLTINSVSESRAPNEGVDRTYHHAAQMALVGLVGGIIFISFLLMEYSVNNKNFDYKNITLIIPVIILFWANDGGMTFLKHKFLRNLLQKKGSIPKNYEDFLVYAARINLLLQRGGTFEFIHPTLRDYFAELEDEPEAAAE